MSCLFLDMLSDDFPSDVRVMLEDNSMLGRLSFSVVDGLDEAGKVTELYTFGGRSAAIYKCERQI